MNHKFDKKKGLAGLAKYVFKLPSRFQKMSEN